MLNDNLITVGGAGGFIGGALVADLLRKGHTRIRAVDIKPFSEWYQKFDEVENLQLDLADLVVPGTRPLLALLLLLPRRRRLLLLLLPLLLPLPSSSRSRAWSAPSAPTASRTR